MSLSSEILPQVILGGSLVGQVFQIDSQSLTEGFGGQEVVHHPDDRSSFTVGDPVKDLLDLIWMLDRNADWMGTLQGINPELVFKLTSKQFLITNFDKNNLMAEFTYPAMILQIDIS